MSLSTKLPNRFCPNLFVFPNPFQVLSTDVNTENNWNIEECVNEMGEVYHEMKKSFK